MDPPLVIREFDDDRKGVITRRGGGMDEAPLVTLLYGGHDEADAVGSQPAFGIERSGKLADDLVVVLQGGRRRLSVPWRSDTEPRVAPPLGQPRISAEYVPKSGGVQVGRRLERQVIVDEDLLEVDPRPVGGISQQSAPLPSGQEAVDDGAGRNDGWHYQEGQLHLQRHVLGRVKRPSGAYPDHQIHVVRE